MDTVAIIGAVAAAAVTVIAAVAAAVASVIQARQSLANHAQTQTAVQAIHVEVNDRLTQLLARTQEAAHAEGVVAGVAQAVAAELARVKALPVAAPTPE